MGQMTTTDVRTEAQKIEMMETFDEYEYEYRNEDTYTVVFEDDDTLIIADHSGYEINEWASDFGADREDLRAAFRAIADEKMGEHDAHEAFSYSDPVVFEKSVN